MGWPQTFIGTAAAWLIATVTLLAADRLLFAYIAFAMSFAFSVVAVVLYRRERAKDPSQQRQKFNDWIRAEGHKALKDRRRREPPPRANTPKVVTTPVPDAPRRTFGIVSDDSSFTLDGCYFEGLDTAIQMDGKSRGDLRNIQIIGPPHPPPSADEPA